jgi:elongation factor G
MCEGADGERLDDAVATLAKQDPSLRFRVLPQPGAVEIEGVGETHLDIVVARLRREFDLDLVAEKPRVAYRETLVRGVDVHVRENGWALALTVEPAERGDGCRVESRLPGDDRGLFLRLEGALREAVELGGLRGFPLIDLVVAMNEALVSSDASADALERLAARAVEQALRQGGTVVQEPIMRVEVVTPDEHLGAVLGEITGMRGHVKRIESRGSIRALAAYVPLSEVGGCPERLRRLSGGRANFAMQFAYYERRPAEFADALEAMNP